MKGNPNCDETNATLMITGDALDPIRVTKLVGVDPAFARRKGDLFGKPERPVKSLTGIWALESEPHLTSSVLEEHINLLLDMIGRPPTAFYDYLESEGLEALIRCYWMSATGQGGPVLSSRLLGRLAELHLGLDFHFYSAV